MFGGINFDDLVKNSSIRQIKIPAKISGYTVFNTRKIIPYIHEVTPKILTDFSAADLEFSGEGGVAPLPYVCNQ